MDDPTLCGDVCHAAHHQKITTKPKYLVALDSDWRRESYSQPEEDLAQPNIINSCPGSTSQAHLSLLYVTVAVVGQTMSVLLTSLHPTVTTSGSSGKQENIEILPQNMLVLPTLCNTDMSVAHSQYLTGEIAADNSFTF